MSQVVAPTLSYFTLPITNTAFFLEHIQLSLEVGYCYCNLLIKNSGLKFCILFLLPSGLLLLP